MKSLVNFIKESLIKEKIKELPNHVSGVIVFDIDDTLLRVDKKSMSIYKRVPGEKNEIALSTEEFAKDEDAKDPDKLSWFDYRDFRDPIKVYNSIISGTPLIRNPQMENIAMVMNTGIFHLYFLTSRFVSLSYSSAT